MADSFWKALGKLVQVGVAYAQQVRVVKTAATLAKGSTGKLRGVRAARRTSFLNILLEQPSHHSLRLMNGSCAVLVPSGTVQTQY